MVAVGINPRSQWHQQAGSRPSIGSSSLLWQKTSSSTILVPSEHARDWMLSAPAAILADRRCISPSFVLYAEKYSLPPEDQLEGLGEEDYARIVFVNREEAWVYVEHVDDADKVYGKLCDYMKCVDLHKNQRVWFHKDRIAEIKSEDDSE